MFRLQSSINTSVNVETCFNTRNAQYQHNKIEENCNNSTKDANMAESCQNFAQSSRLNPTPLRFSTQSSSSFAANTSEKDHASTNNKHNHKNGTTSSFSPISNVDLLQKPQNVNNSYASNILSTDLINRKKRKLRTSNTLSGQNLWWPFGLFLLLFCIIITPNVVNALPSNSANFNNRIEPLSQNVRWKRNIVQQPPQLKDASIISTTQNSIISPVESTSKLSPILISSTTPAPTPYTTSDVLLDPDSVVIFNRTAFLNNEEFFNPETKTEIFNINSSLNGTLKFVCTAEVQNRRLFNNITFETCWVDATNAKIVTTGSDLIIDDPWNLVKDKDRQYRCAARLIIPSRAVSGVVHSRAMILRAVRDSTLKMSAKRVDVTHMQRVRLECQYNTTEDQISDFYWSRNDVRIFQTDEYKIYNVQDKSILYIFKAHILHIGEYSCHVLLKDGRELISTNRVDVQVFDDIKNLTNVQEQILPPELLEGRVGQELFVECWKPGAKETRWYRLHSSMKEIISSEPLLSFKNSSARLNGVYECQLEDDFGLVRYYRIEIFIDDNFFNLEPVTFSIIRKHQGTPAKFLCRTFSQLEETPQMAEWFKNGVLLNRPEDNVYRRSSLLEDGPIKGRVVYVAMAQIEDQGFYECIIKRGDTERTQQTLMLVEQTTNLTLNNLTITVDHVKGCFSSQFDLPEDIDHRLATFSTFFLVYFNADMTKPLNIIPRTQGAKCSKDNHCTIGCWVPSYPFLPATSYTFRMSAVFADQRSVITPLSKPVNATSWDGPASRAVHLDWLHDSSKSELELRWKRPTVVGTLKEYQMELMDLDNPQTDADHRRKKYKILIGADQQKYKLNVTAPFALQIRLIPLTRSGPPSLNQLKSFKDFGYTLVSIGEEAISQSMDSKIPPPELKIQQVNLEPKLELHFDRPTAKEYNATSIRIQFRPLMSLHLKSPLESKEELESDGVEELRNDGEKTVVLKEGLKPGTLYQICVAYEKLTAPTVLGFWHCENVPLFDQTGQLNPIREEPHSNEPRYLLPRPINCQKLGCQCVQSKEDHNLVLIKWKTNGESNYKSNAASHVVHFTLNETDPDLEKGISKSRTYKDGNDSVVELRGLFPSLSYRIMIEAQNEQGRGLKGTYFTCKSAKNLNLPPPTSGNVILLGEKVAQVQWKTPLPSSLIHLIPDFDGYILHWRTGNASEQSEFVAGHSSTSIMMATLHPGFEYSAYLTSHSSTTGDSPLMSQPFIIRIPADKPIPTPGKKTKEDKLLNLIQADSIRPWYQTLRFRAYVILAVFALLIIICCSGLAAIIGMKYYDWFQSAHAKKRRRENRNKKAPKSIAGMSSGRASIASSRASLNSFGSGSRQPNLMESEQLIPSNIYGLPMFRDSKHKKNVLDMKGGIRSIGEKKSRQLLNDPQFVRRVSETNKDPTGLGKQWEEVLLDLKRAQQEEIAMIEKRRQEEIEMQTFSIRHQHNSGQSTSSIPSHHPKRHRPRLQRHPHNRMSTTHQISSIDDEDDQIDRKESVQVEIHAQPSNRQLLFNTSNRPPTKTHSLVDINKKDVNNSSKFISDTRLLDPIFVANHLKPQRKHFLKRPSIISLQNEIHSEPPSNLTTPNAKILCPDNRMAEGGTFCLTSTPIEFHFGPNGIERRRLKTTTATPVYQHRKKFSASGSTATASLPNLADSGIVYDEMVVVGHANGYFHHPSHDCPTALHPITSMKILRLHSDDEEEDKSGECEEKRSFNYPQNQLQPSTQNEIESVGAVDGESAISTTSSGASSRDSGSNRYEEEIDVDEESQLISPQTPIRTFIPPPTLTTKDYCSIQICNFTPNEEKRPLEVMESENLNGMFRPF